MSSEVPILQTMGPTTKDYEVAKSRPGECRLLPGMWLVSIGPVDGNWANPDTMAVLWASPNASSYMFGLDNVNVVGFPINPNPADFFHLPALGSRWRPFGGPGDNGKLFRMAAQAIALNQSRALFVCLDLDVFRGPMMDLRPIIDAFFAGRLCSWPQPPQTSLGRIESMPKGRDPTPAERRFGFRLWMYKLNIAPEIQTLIGARFHSQSRTLEISNSWYLVSHCHILKPDQGFKDVEIQVPKICREPTNEFVTRIALGCQHRPDAANLLWKGPTHATPPPPRFQSLGGYSDVNRHPNHQRGNGGGNGGTFFMPPTLFSDYDQLGDNSTLLK